MYTYTHTHTYMTAKGLSSIARSSQWRLVGAVSLCVFTLSQALACFLCKAYRHRGRYRPNHGALSFSHHFTTGRSARKGGLLVQLQILGHFFIEEVPRMMMAPVKTIRLQVAKDCVLQRVAKDIGPLAPELQIMMQWRQAERSR